MGVDQEKQFMVEGPQAVREALKAHLQSPLLDAVYVTESAYERHPDIAELLEQAHGTLHLRKAAVSLCVS